MKENPHLSHYFFIFFGTKPKWNKLATYCRKCPLQYEPRCEKTGHWGFLTRSDTNRAVKPQNMSRCLKLPIYEEEGLYYLCSGYREADLLLCF